MASRSNAGGHYFLNRNMTKTHIPGDIIIDHFMPECSDVDREIARERLQQYAAWLLRVAMRQTCEELGLDPVTRDPL